MNDRYATVHHLAAEEKRVEEDLVYTSVCKNCSGLLIPDTEMGGKFTAIAEVFHDKTTSYVFHRVQA